MIPPSLNAGYQTLTKTSFFSSSSSSEERVITSGWLSNTSWREKAAVTRPLPGDKGTNPVAFGDSAPSREKNIEKFITNSK